MGRKTHFSQPIRTIQLILVTGPKDSFVQFIIHQNIQLCIFYKQRNCSKRKECHITLTRKSVFSANIKYGLHLQASYCGQHKHVHTFGYEHQTNMTKQAGITDRRWTTISSLPVSKCPQTRLLSGIVVRKKQQTHDKDTPCLSLSHLCCFFAHEYTMNTYQLTKLAVLVQVAQGRNRYRIGQTPMVGTETPGIPPKVVWAWTSCQRTHIDSGTSLLQHTSPTGHYNHITSLE